MKSSMTKNMDIKWHRLFNSTVYANVIGVIVESCRKKDFGNFFTKGGEFSTSKMGILGGPGFSFANFAVLCKLLRELCRPQLQQDMDGYGKKRSDPVGDCVYCLHTNAPTYKLGDSSNLGITCLYANRSITQ